MGGWAHGHAPHPWLELPPSKGVGRGAGTGVVIKYVATDLQAADIFTKALQPLKWDHALKLLGIRTSLPEKLKDVRPEMSKQ